MKEENKDTVKILLVSIPWIFVSILMTQWMWNNIVVSVFDINTITYPQAFVIGIVINLFFNRNVAVEKDFKNCLGNIIATLIVWGIAAIVYSFAF